MLLLGRTQTGCWLAPTRLREERAFSNKNKESYSKLLGSPLRRVEREWSGRVMNAASKTNTNATSLPPLFKRIEMDNQQSDSVCGTSTKSLETQLKEALQRLANAEALIREKDEENKDLLKRLEELNGSSDQLFNDQSSEIKYLERELREKRSTIKEFRAARNDVYLGLEEEIDELEEQEYELRERELEEMESKIEEREKAVKKKEGFGKRSSLIDRRKSFGSN